MMSAGSPAAALHEVSVSKAPRPDLLVAERPQRLQARFTIGKLVHADHDVDNRLGAEARDRRTAEVLDRQRPRAERRQDPLAFLLIALGPARVVLEDNDLRCAHPRTNPLFRALKQRRLLAMSYLLTAFALSARISATTPVMNGV